MVMRFGPKAGQEITIASKQLVNFRVARIAKEMVFSRSKPLPDLFAPYIAPDFKFSTDATELANPYPFTGDLGTSLTLSDGTAASLVAYQLPDLRLPSGQILACDLMIASGDPFRRSVPSGHYPLAVVKAGRRNAFAIIRFSSNRVVKWEMAATAAQNVATLKGDEVFGYGVDSGTGGFCDASAMQLIQEANENDDPFFKQVTDEMHPSDQNSRRGAHVESPNGSIAVFSSGFGDGHYPSYFGLDAAGEPAMLVTDFKVVKWRSDVHLTCSVILPSQ